MPGEFNFKEGDGFSFERFITAEAVRQFAGIVGDTNPIHLDAAYADVI